MFGFFVFILICLIVLTFEANKRKWPARDGLIKISAGLGVILLLVYFLSPDDHTDKSVKKLFSAAQLAGAIAPVRLTVDEVQHNKSVMGGDLVMASCLLPKSIKNEQLRETELSALKELKVQYPDCEWFQVWFSDDDRMYNAGHYLGKAEYKEGKVELSGGVISDKDIAAAKGEIWKPTEEDIILAFEFYKINQAAENAHHEKAKKLSKSGRDKEASEEYLKDPISDKEIFKAIAKKRGITESSVAKSVKNTYECYSSMMFRNL